MGFRSLERYIKAYRCDGLAGLVDGRSTRQTSPAGRVDAALVSLLEHAIGAQTNLSTGTRSRLIGQVGIEAKQLGLPVPSRATLYRVVDNLAGSRAPIRTRHDPAHPGQPARIARGVGKPLHVLVSSSKSTALRWI